MAAFCKTAMTARGGRATARCRMGDSSISWLERRRRKMSTSPGINICWQPNVALAAYSSSQCHQAASSAATLNEINRARRASAGEACAFRATSCRVACASLRAMRRHRRVRHALPASRHIGGRERETKRAAGQRRRRRAIIGRPRRRRPHRACGSNAAASSSSLPMACAAKILSRVDERNRRREK